MVEGRTDRPVIQRERCHSCDVCIRGCPAELIPEYRQETNTLRGVLYQEKFSTSKRKIYVPPCQEACPIHQDIRGYVALIAEGKFREALEVIGEVNPFPAVCGFICHHPCEQACLREGMDAPISIRLLKRFVAENGQKAEAVKKPPKKKRRGKVLVIGSGPAGLAASNDLRLHGFEVTIFEALPVLGGMLAVGIPEFRLPRDILKRDIDRIRALGIQMETNRRFRFDGNGKVLQQLGFQAAFLSIGAHESQKLGIAGESLGGVLPGLEFLRAVNLGEKTKVGKRVAVIGGGNVAIDAARSAIRLGAETVDVYYRRSRREMPAISDEVEEAICEGVRIHVLSSPIQIIGRGGKAVGINFVKMELTKRDETGRRKPVPVKGSNRKVYADTVISAVGQRVNRNVLRGLDLDQSGNVRINAATYETSIKGVFAGGDVVTGPGWAIDAIAAGKRGAEAIYQYLT